MQESNKNYVVKINSDNKSCNHTIMSVEMYNHDCITTKIINKSCIMLA